MIDYAYVKDFIVLHRSLRDQEIAMLKGTLGNSEGTVEEENFCKHLLSLSIPVTMSLLYSVISPEHLSKAYPELSAKMVIVESEKLRIKLPYKEKDIRDFIKSDEKVSKLRSKNPSSLSSNDLNTLKKYYIMVNRLWRSLKSSIPTDKKRDLF